MLPLDGLKVLDLSRLLPGAYCTLLLADLGADVVKVEEPGQGDGLRQTPPFRGEQSALHLVLNRNKRSVALDLKSAGGREAVLALISLYDVVVEGFRPGVMDRLGLDFSALRVANPRVILCSLSGYGQTGPLRLRAGHDLNFQARSGVLGYSPGDEGGPAMPAVQVADLGGGSLFAAMQILAAILERQRTGQGRHLDVAMCDGATAFMTMPLGVRLLLGKEGVPLRRGEDPLNGGLPCYNVYRTRDGRFLSVSALEPKFWSGFCAAVGRMDLLDSGQLLGEEGRQARDEVARVVASRTLAEWEALLQDKDLCCEPVREGDELLNDPLLAARGLYVEGPGIEGAPERYLRTPLSFESPELRRAPELGQHTAEVLAEVGLEPPA